MFLVFVGNMCDHHLILLRPHQLPQDELVALRACLTPVYPNQVPELFHKEN
jgi:hypothetical protein